jgi:hypothetical protein
VAVAMMRIREMMMRVSGGLVPVPMNVSGALTIRDLRSVGE